MAGNQSYNNHNYNNDNNICGPCTCQAEHKIETEILKSHEAFRTNLKARFEKDEPRVYKACCDILHKYAVAEMEGREAFERFSCILVNEAELLKEATILFASYTTAVECFTRFKDLADHQDTFVPLSEILHHFMRLD